MAFTARPTSTDLLTKLVNQAAHGLSVGQPIIYNGTTYVTSKADTSAHCQGTMMVSSVPDANSFYATQTGWVNNLNSSFFEGAVILAGFQYYISSVDAGKFTLVAPTAAGQVVLPCLVCDTTTTGYFTGGSGTVITSANELATVITTDATISMSADTRYIVESNVPCDLTLPVSANLGQIIIIDNNSTDEVLIGQNDAPMQIIRFGNVETTAGVHGGLNSVTRGDSITLVCISTDNTLWMAEASQGSNWEVI